MPQAVHKCEKFTNGCAESLIVAMTHGWSCQYIWAMEVSFCNVSCTMHNLEPLQVRHGHDNSHKMGWWCWKHALKSTEGMRTRNIDCSGSWLSTLTYLWTCSFGKKICPILNAPCVMLLLNRTCSASVSSPLSLKCQWLRDAVIAGV